MTKMNITSINEKYINEEITVEGIVDEIKDLYYAEIVYLLELPSILREVDSLIEDVKVIFEKDLI